MIGSERLGRSDGNGVIVVFPFAVGSPIPSILVFFSFMHHSSRSLDELKSMADGSSVSERATPEMLEYVRKHRKKLDLLEFEPDFGRQVGVLRVVNCRQS